MRIKVLAVITLLAVLLCLLPTGNAMAVSVSPITGIVGTEITITDLTEGYTYSIFWDSTLIKQGIVGSNGRVVFSVPASCSGEHSIIVEQPTDTQVLSQSYTSSAQYSDRYHNGCCRNKCNRCRARFRTQRKKRQCHL